MEDTSTPKHRKNVPVRTEPRVQPVPRHVGEYTPEDRTHERLGASAFPLIDACINAIEESHRIRRVES